ncbi:unnamed protein product [Paramecium sonneborni]|uniref:Uncharacterized protein n=1 Tax=Paramecium sonneborni TaxID=65129 RepID=A0A8S1P4A4_9CILI|nr:unnamed protein product [Paramecium sonneborni]
MEQGSSNLKQHIRQTLKNRMLIVIVLMFFIQSSQTQTLVYQNFFGSLTNMMIDWEIQQNDGHTVQLTSCGTKNILKISECSVYIYNTVIVKSFQLRSHNQIVIQFLFWRFNFNNKDFIIEIDKQIVHSQIYRNSPTSLCSSSVNNNDIIQISITVQHVNSLAVVKLKSDWGGWGLSNFQLFIDYIETLYEGCFSQNQVFVKGCSYCVKGECIECQEGWEYNIIQKECNTICGDQKIVYDEECEDDNLKPFDGCYLCKFSCPQNCFNCQFGVCLKCQGGYKWNSIQNQCVSICNDNWQQIENEQCDDGNNIQFDGCYKCQLTCQIECQFCQQGTCIICIDGWHLIDNKSLISNENCDDGNNIQDDGCFDCQYECSSGCLSCYNKSFCIKCQTNFEIINYQCQPICGDRIVIYEQEDCDDGNDIPYDGCYNCQFQCQQVCYLCEYGICLLPCSEDKQYIDGQCIIPNNDSEELSIVDTCLYQGCLKCSLNLCIICESGYILENGICLMCGNGIRQDDEQCDDGNNLNQDGCSNLCIIENQWNCTENVNFFSQCFRITTPSVTYLNQTFNYQYVTLTYTNQVKLDLSTFIFLDQNSFSIENLNPNQYQIILIPLIEIDQNQLKNISYELSIDIYQPTDFNPRLKLIFNALLWDQNDLPVYPSEQFITLKVPKILSEVQIETANNFQTLNYGIMMSLMILSILMILCREFEIFQEILDILQFQSFLKYINVNYPQNLFIYFESSDFVQITPLLIQSNFGNILGQFIPQIQVQTSGKFQQYQVNADLLTNLYCQFAQIILALFAFIFAHQFVKLVYQYCFTQKFLNSIDQLKSNFQKKIYIWIYYKIQLVQEFQKILTIQGITQFIQANSWDLLFKVFLFLHSSQQQGLRQNLSIVICFIILLITAKIMINTFRGQFKKINIYQLKNSQLETLILFKKTMFLIILIAIQVQPIVQCILLSFILFIYVGFLLTNYKLDFDLILKTWTEIPVILFTLINLSFCDDFEKFITPSKQILLGFFQICLLILSLFAPIIKLSLKFYQKLRISRKQREKQQMMKTAKIFEILKW